MGGPGASRVGGLRAAAAVVVGLAVTAGAVGTPPESVPAERETTAAVPDTGAVKEVVPDRVAVLYFHRTIRCSNCLKFESYTEEAIRAAFPDELGEGVLEWKVLDYEEPGNEHLVDDYCITESSVIVVEFRDGEEQSWANLDAIWGFVKDRPTFLSYIQNEVGSRLDALNEPAADDGDTSSTVDHEISTGR